MTKLMKKLWVSIVDSVSSKALIAFVPMIIALIDIKAALPENGDRTENTEGPIGGLSLGNGLLLLTGGLIVVILFLGVLYMKFKLLDQQNKEIAEIEKLKIKEEGEIKKLELEKEILELQKDNRQSSANEDDN